MLPLAIRARENSLKLSWKFFFWLQWWIIHSSTKFELTTHQQGPTKKTEPSSFSTVLKAVSLLTRISFLNIYFLQRESLQSATAAPNWLHTASAQAVWKTECTPFPPSKHHNSQKSVLSITENFKQSLLFITASQQRPLSYASCVAARSHGSQRAYQISLYHAPGLCCFHKLLILIVKDLSCKSTNSGVLFYLFPFLHGLCNVLNNPWEVKAEHLQCTHPCNVKHFLGTRQTEKGIWSWKQNEMQSAKVQKYFKSSKPTN